MATRLRDQAGGPGLTVAACYHPCCDILPHNPVCRDILPHNPVCRDILPHNPVCRVASMAPWHL